MSNLRDSFQDNVRSRELLARLTSVESWLRIIEKERTSARRSIDVKAVRKCWVWVRNVELVRNKNVNFSLVGFPSVEIGTRAGVAVVFANLHNFGRQCQRLTRCNTKIEVGRKESVDLEPWTYLSFLCVEVELELDQKG